MLSKRRNPARRTLFEDVKRACYSAYGVIRLAEEVLTCLESGLDTVGSALATTDPERGMLTNVFARRLLEELIETYTTVVYPAAYAREIIDLADSGRIVHEDSPPPSDEALSELAGPQLHVAAVDHGMLWGWLYLVRGPAAAAFTDGERALLRRLAPHVGAGLRRAVLLDAARMSESEPGDTSPGVLVVTPSGRITLRCAGAARLCQDIAPAGWDAERPPPAVAGALAALHAAERTAHPDDDAPLQGTVRAQGRSGRWYEVTASRAAVESADSTAVVVLAPIGPEGRIGLLSRLYGLTPRERDVLQHVALGKSTKAIARELSLSPYTVQEHIGKASEKVGVRGRRELVGKLYR